MHRNGNRDRSKIISWDQVTEFKQSEHNTVNEILLSDADLIDACSSELLPLLSLVSSLCVLDLSFNNLSDNFWICNTSTKNNSTPFSRFLVESSDSLTKWPSLTTINLSNNCFTEGSVSTLKVFLDRCPHLTHFDLSLNTFGYAQPNNIECSKEGIDVLFSSMDGHQPCHIHTLDLSCLHITDASLVSLLNCKFAQTSLIRLYLRSNNLTDCAAICIAQSLPCMLKLEVLSLAGNAIGDQGAAAIAFGFDQLAVLQTLDLDENEISEDGMLTIYHTLCGLNTVFPLRFLHLGRNPPSTSRNALVMEDRLKQIELKLQEKILETHMLDGIGCLPNVESSTSFIDAVPTPPPVPISTRLSLTGKKLRKTLLISPAVPSAHLIHVALRTIRDSLYWWHKLEELDLSGNGIETHGACEIGLFLALVPALRVLNVSHNHINDEGITSLAEGLEANQILCELNLNHNQITDFGARQLYLKAFTSNLQRRILLSEGNPLTSECKVMVTAISQAYDLRKRFLREFSNLDKLEFVGQKLRQYGAAALVESLLTTPTAICTALDISHNYLGDEGAIEIAKLLRGYSRLTKLNMSFNDIGDIGAMEVAEALTVNKTLETLSWHSAITGSIVKPKLTEVGLTALAHALEKHKAITTIDIRDNVMSPGLITVLVQMLQKNPRILKFNGSSSAVFVSRFE